MASNVVPKPEVIALLSAASVAEDSISRSSEGALQLIAGQSLLGCQIQALQHAGVANFLIEVDNVPGELLNLADRFRQLGARLEFVRSVKDLRSFLKPGAQLAVLAEAHYFSAPAIDDLMEKAAPFVATVDGRDENTAFERIDLNSRWAGFAMLDAPTALSMAELPTGWSMTSSLLRHAVQNNIPLHPVAQSNLQGGDLVRVSSGADIDRIVAQMLAERSERPRGFIERHLFGPLAKRLAPTIWATNRGASTIDASSVIFAIGSTCLAAIGWGLAAATAALLAILLHNVRNVVQGFDENERQITWQSGLFWAVLALSLFAAAWTHTGYGSDILAFSALAVGLALLAQKMNLPRWSAAIVRSPALLAVAMLVATILSVFSGGLKLVAFTQLAVLIAALYLPDVTGKNDNHA